MLEQNYCRHSLQRFRATQPLRLRPADGHCARRSQKQTARHHKGLSALAGLVTLAVLAANERDAGAASRQIGTSESAAATLEGGQRHAITDANTGGSWVFWFDGSAVAYAGGTTNPVKFTPAGSLPQTTPRFSVAYASIGGVGYAFVSVESSENLGDILVYQGAIEAASITFAAPVSVLTAPGASDFYEKPTVAVGYDNTLWVAAQHCTSFGCIAVVRRSVEPASANPALLDFGSSVSVGSALTTARDTILVSQGSAGMALILGAPQFEFYRSSDAATWSPPQTAGASGVPTFSLLDSGLTGPVNAIAVVGTDVYVGGDFRDAFSNVDSDYLVRIDASGWHSVGTGLNGPVYALAVLGSDLIVGGDFQNAGGNPAADYIASLNDTGWHALTGGLDNRVFALAVHETKLYVGGAFTDAGGESAADGVALWDSGQWYPLGSGLSGGIVFTLAVAFPNVYAGGSFTKSGATTVANVAQWNGTDWVPMGAGLQGCVYALTIAEDNVSPIAGGDFTASGTSVVYHIGRWNGSTWNAIGSGLSGSVRSLALYNSNLVVGGNFYNAGGVADADYLALRTDSGWYAVDGGLNGSVLAMTVADGSLFVGGAFASAGGVNATQHLAQWNASGWHSLGASLTGSIRALASSTGANLVIGGNFQGVGGVSEASFLATWDGSTWREIASGDGQGVTGTVAALAPSGSDLFVGGNFFNAGSVPGATSIARWDGSQWWALDHGTDGVVNAIVASGIHVWVAGSFSSASGVHSPNVAHWDGVAWNAMGSG